MTYYTYNTINRPKPTLRESYVPDEDRVWKRDPKLWGPHLWMYLHYSAANYPEFPTPIEVHDMTTWLRTMYVTIPCATCSQHYREYIDSTPDLPRICSSRDTLFKYLVDLHNKVNERHHKSTMSYEEAYQLYN